MRKKGEFPVASAEIRIVPAKSGWTDDDYDEANDALVAESGYLVDVMRKAAMDYVRKAGLQRVLTVEVED